MLFTVTQDSRAGQVNMKRDLWTTICLRWVPSFVKDLCNRYISFHKTLYVSDCLTFRNCCHLIKLQQQIRVSSATRVRYKYLSQHHPILLIQPNHTGDKNTPMCSFWLANFGFCSQKTWSQAYTAIFLRESPKTFVWEFCLLISRQSED